MIFSGRALTSLAMLTVFAAMSLVALGFPEKARMMPLLVGVPGTLMALAQLIKDLRTEDPDRAFREGELERRRERHMLLWLAAFLVGVLGFGFLFGAPVLVFAFLRFGQRESWTVALVSAAGVWVILYAVFTRMLGLFLFEGLILPALTG